MTNEEVLKNMTTSELADFLQRMCNTAQSDCLDWNAWLQREDFTKFSYRGQAGVWLDSYGNETKCQLVEPIKFLNADFMTILIRDKFGKLVQQAVPIENVRVL